MDFLQNGDGPIFSVVCGDAGHLYTHSFDGQYLKEQKYEVQVGNKE